jgi:hypothetical protein
VRPVQALRFLIHEGKKINYNNRFLLNGIGNNLFKEKNARDKNDVMETALTMNSNKDK